MNTPSPDHLHSLLESIKAPIETFTHFPEVIRSGTVNIEKEDFDYLYAEGYLEETHKDKFGRNFRLSELGMKKSRPVA